MTTRRKQPLKCKRRIYLPEAENLGMPLARSKGYKIEART